MAHDDNEDGKPRLRLIPAADDATRARLKQNERDGERQRAEEQLDWPLRKLAANVLRIIRGAGKPNELLMDCVHVIKAAETYIDAHGSAPEGQLLQAKIKFLVEERGAEHHRAQLRALETTVCGALQYAASTLMDQAAQLRAGEYEMVRGAREHERLIGEENARWAAERAPAKLASKPRKAAPRKSPEQEPLSAGHQRRKSTRMRPTRLNARGVERHGAAHLQPGTPHRSVRWPFAEASPGAGIAQALTL